ALVGYTNAGKSTLLNRMTGADVYVQDQLFATLDAVSRRIETAERTPFLLVDTVGFIRKLPHALVSAFRSTLDEAALADVLVLVSDGASGEMLKQHETVEQVLQELGATEQPRIEVINKCDLGAAVPALPGAVMVSAKTGEGIDELSARIAAELQKTYAPVTFFLPFSQYGLLGQIRPLGRVISENHTDTGTELTMVIAQADRDRLVSRYGQGIIKK
ncbi:MAG: 50S ribosome-binding GTPase, partial [Clostridia bacterium]|nr:50S ribosome-binding GTPase [Clostridia bacterium]